MTSLTAHRIQKSATGWGRRARRARRAVAGSAVFLVLTLGPSAYSQGKSCPTQVANFDAQIASARAGYNTASDALFQCYNNKINAERAAAAARFLPQLRGVQAKGQAAAVRAKYDAELRRIRAQWSSYGGEKKALQDAFSRRLAELTAARNKAKAGMCADPFGERPMDAATATFYQSEDLKAKIAGSDTVLRDYAGRRSRDLAELEAIKVRMGELQGAWGYSEAFARVRWQQIDAEEIYKNVFEQLVSPDLPEDLPAALRKAARATNLLLDVYEAGMKILDWGSALPEKGRLIERLNRVSADFRSVDQATSTELIKRQMLRQQLDRMGRSPPPAPTGRTGSDAGFQDPATAGCKAR